MKERFVIGLLHGSESEVFECRAKVPEMIVVEVPPNTYDRVLDLLVLDLMMKLIIQGREEAKK